MNQEQQCHHLFRSAGCSEEEPGSALLLTTAAYALRPAGLYSHPGSYSGWPDPAFAPERQCRGRYATEDLRRFLPRARLALWLPSTRSVTLDAERRCLTVVVNSKGAGRLAELVMRGVAVPRGAVLLQLLDGRPRRG